jgi:hypothetical protein
LCKILYVFFSVLEHFQNLLFCLVIFAHMFCLGNKQNTNFQCKQSLVDMWDYWYLAFINCFLFSQINLMLMNASSVRSGLCLGADVAEYEKGTIMYE